MTKNHDLRSINGETRVYQTFRGIQVLKAIPGSLSKKDEFDLDKLISDPYKYFEKRAKRLLLETQKSYPECTPGTAAYNDGEGNIHICPQGVSLRSTIQMSAILIHEAAHTSGKSHVQCTNQPWRFIDEAYNQMGSCDDSYSGGGSYAIEAEYLVKLSRNSGLSLEERKNVKDSTKRNSTFPH